MIDISKITKEIARKWQILAEFETSTPADDAYWAGWKMAESIAQRRGLTLPTKSHAEQVLRENIQWLEGRLGKSSARQSLGSL